MNYNYLMEALNSVESKSFSPIENMQRLEKAILLADQRYKIRKEAGIKASHFLASVIVLPLSVYLVYHFLHPNGVMQNHRASSGTYMFWASNFLSGFKSQTQMLRPEFYLKESSTSLNLYSKKI